jgi:hypothetical protein
VTGGRAFLVAAAGLFSAVAAGAAEWVKINEKEGVVVHKKEVPGSDLLAFMGHGTVDASILRVASVIFDTTRAPEWMEDLVESRLIRWLSPGEFIEYDHIGTPFVMKDRDFLSKVALRIDTDKKQMVFQYRSTDDSAVPPTSYVRGDLMNTTFTLTSVGQGAKTDIYGEIHCDPKGSVPKWLVNFFQKDWPVQTLVNLRKQVRKADIKDDPRISELLKGILSAASAAGGASK